jgi:hypothetical protein
MQLLLKSGIKKSRPKVLLPNAFSVCTLFRFQNATKLSFVQEDQFTTRDSSLIKLKSYSINLNFFVNDKKIGGVYTNFRMPDLYSFGLGGGSLVNLTDSISVGPISVGCQV